MSFTSQARSVEAAHSLPSAVTALTARDRQSWRRSMLPIVIDMATSCQILLATLSAVIGLAVMTLVMACDTSMTTAQVGLTGFGFLFFSGLVGWFGLARPAARSLLLAVQDGRLDFTERSGNMMLRWKDGVHIRALVVPRFIGKHLGVRNRLRAASAIQGFYFMDPSLALMRARAENLCVHEAPIIHDVESRNLRLGQLQEHIAAVVALSKN